MMEFYDVISFGSDIKILNESGIVISCCTAESVDFLGEISDLDYSSIYSREIGTLGRDKVIEL